MQIPTMPYRRLNIELPLYVESLRRFLKQHDLEQLYCGPVDHVAVKTADSADFHACLGMWLPLAISASAIELDKRRLATLAFLVDISLGQLGGTPLLEIMEPRPEKAGEDFIGLEHIELLNPDLDTLAMLLQRQGVAYTKEDNGFHQALVVVINGFGQEVKFTNRSLKQIVEEQTADGTTTTLK